MAFPVQVTGGLITSPGKLAVLTPMAGGKSVQCAYN
jgi:hypothetical protein